jgi:6-pyruvoyltetrahydropterin/6-carboxytetrahydropterin synthase
MTQPVIITRKLEFDAGHRVLGHEGKCRHLHGHRYVAEITCQAPRLDSLGMVVDFSVIKSKVGGWLDANWDHNFICHPEDPIAGLWSLQSSRAESIGNSLRPMKQVADNIFQGKAPFIMPPEYANPTAENMAAYLYSIAWQLLRTHHIDVTAVRLYETPNCWADYIG